LLRQPRAQ